MSELYPFKFTSIFKEKIWGGQKIKTILGKDFGDLDNCGETWELSGVEGNVSRVANGLFKGQLLSNLISKYQEKLMGRFIYEKFGNTFPLLIKFIDSAQNLSVQVHPSDELATKEMQNGFGKTEMWYIIQADEGAKLVNGFSKNTNRKEYLSTLESGNLMELLHWEEVSEGDVYYLPSGRVHTIGKGLLLVEIQQTSDITYRIYDFDRTDKEGKKRDLHTKLALEAINYEKPEQVKNEYSSEVNRTNPIVSSPFFTTNKFILNNTMEIDGNESDCFKIYIGLRGSGKIANEPIHFGEVLLIPAVMKPYTIKPEGELELLETYIEL